MKKINSNLSKSLDLSLNKFVQACAGAGKTFTLAKRYCAILDSFAKNSEKTAKKQWLGVKNILVITFTKKAAVEMGNRIYKDLNILLSGRTISELKNQEIDFGRNLQSKKNIKYNEWIRSTFSQNMISTIDGFCNKILKENAYKIGLDPMYKMEDENIEKKKYDELLDKFIVEKSTQIDENFKIILNNLTIDNIKEHFKFLDNHKEGLSDWIDRINSKTEKEIWDNWLKNYTPIFDVNKWIDKLKLLWEDAKSNVLDEDDKMFVILKEINEIIISIENDDNNDFQKRNKYATEVITKFMTKKQDKFLSNKSGGKKTSWSNNFKEIIGEFIDELNGEFSVDEIVYTPNELDRESIPIYKSLITLYWEFYEILKQYKDEHNYLTFNDIIIKTNEILEDKEVCKKYRERYSHIMVDEFQDTNNVRWEIIRKIASDEFGNLRKSGLFVVGDIKQSIYRFANADVKIMNITRELLKKNGGDIIDFNDNYRSSENYINNVINKIFPNVMKNSTEEIESYEAFFEPTNFIDSNQSEKNIAEKTDICCTINICKNDTEIKSKDFGVLQTVLNVKDALKWANENNLNSKSSPVIAVLLRKFTHIQRYLSLFQKYNIDFEIVAGKGLFNQQELFDIYHFIRILINPYDDLALIGLLRSPFFSVKDSTIHKLLSRKKYDNVYSEIKNNSKMSYIVDEIENWRELSKIYSLDKLIYKILSENDRELGYISELGGKQRLANLNKTLDLIFQLVLDGVSLNGIYDFFKFQIEHEGNASQAEVASKNIVQIMTIHKAKGLEFPVVILPDLAGRLASDKSTIKMGGIENNKNEMIQEVGISLKDEDDESVKSNLLNYIKSRSKKEDEAEDKRLFYVAVTRAIYKIYFLADVSKLKDTSKANNWWNREIRTIYDISNEFEEKSVDTTSHIQTKIEKYFGSDIVDEINKYLDSSQNEKGAKWENFVIDEWTKKYFELNPHDIMELTSPKIKYSNKKDVNGEFNRVFGIIFHKIMEMRWWNLENDRSEIEKYLQAEYPEVSKMRVFEKLRIHLEGLKTKIK